MENSTPLCRCRVLYLGNSVPTITKDGLQGIQEPLRKLYPMEGLDDTRGIDGWLCVWMNGLLLQYADDPEKEQFFPIESLHYCAAVRFVNITGYSVAGGCQQFLPLDSPLANLPDSKHPPIFAAILRRTTGVRVLECHAFVCTTPSAANALVRSCFQSYAESSMLNANVGTLRRSSSGLESPTGPTKAQGDVGTATDRSSSSNSDWAVENGYESDTDRIGSTTWQRRQQAGEYDAASLSSSAAGRYKKKEATVTRRRQKQKNVSPSMTKVVENPYPTYSRALVPYQYYQQPAASVDRHKSLSETDLRVKYQGMDSMVPYEPYVTYPSDTLPYDQRSSVSIRQSVYGKTGSMAPHPPMFLPMPFSPFRPEGMLPPPPPPPMSMVPMPPPHPGGPFPPAMAMGAPMMMVPPPRRKKKRNKAARRGSHPDLPLMMPPMTPPHFPLFEGPCMLPGPPFMPPPGFMPPPPPPPMMSSYRPPFPPPFKHPVFNSGPPGPWLDSGIYGERPPSRLYVMNGKASQAFPKAPERSKRPIRDGGFDDVDVRLRDLRISGGQLTENSTSPKPLKSFQRESRSSVHMMY